MSADLIRLVLLVAMAPFVTFNFLAFTFGFRDWRRSLVGWRLMFESLGLAALVDISLVYHFLGDDYSLRDVVSITVFTVVLVGAVFGTVTLAQGIREKHRRRRG